MSPGLRRRYAVAGQCAAIQFAIASFVGCFHVWRQGAGSPAVYFVIAAIPLSAALLLIGLAALLPNFVGVGSIRFPLNVTMPLAFAAVTVATVMLWTTTGNGLVATPEILRSANLWVNASLLSVTTLAQFLVLSLVALARIGP